jgi:acetyl-CoA C-acetyltransferase
MRPVDLVVGLIGELRERFPAVPAEAIDDIVLGVVTPVGEQGADVAMAAAMEAGLPDQVSGLQVNRYCASGLEAVNLAAQKVISGWEHVVLAGGVESMSRVRMGGDGGAYMTDPVNLWDNYFVPQGVAADLIATMDGLDRRAVDTYAAMSQERASQAWQEGRFARSVVPVRDSTGLLVLDHDEHIRNGTTPESLGKLPAAFVRAGEAGFDATALFKYHWVERINHVHSAGNSSGVVDGASLVMVASDHAVEAYRLTPRARITATALRGADPTIMLTGPAPATKKLLGVAGLAVEDIDLFELNEAFASVVLHYQRELKIPDDKINVNGGAIAMGHALGATGGMLVGTVLDELERQDARRAVVTLCAGAGMGIATLVERV